MKLAVIGKILGIRPIDGKDLIQAATVVCGDAGKWEGVVKKDIGEGDKVVVFLQDAILPPVERFAFMASRKYRVSMARFGGVPSECLILPCEGDEANFEIGDDMTAALGIVKHEKPIPATMAGDAKGNFPSFIPKTDEPNFQREGWAFMENEAWYATVKYDGTSCTVWNDEDGMHVCSRNLELKEFSDSGAGNVYWRMARKYDLDVLPAEVAIQFEIIGPGIQGNPLQLDELEIRVFTAYSVTDRQRLGFASVVMLCDDFDLPRAAIMATGCGGPEFSADELRDIASRVKYGDKPGEGVVIRSMDCTQSIKVINLDYKN